MKHCTPNLRSDHKVNLLYLIWSLEMGGAEQVVMNLARGMDRTIFKPMVCCLNWKGRMAGELEREGIPVFVLGKRPGFDPVALFRLAWLLRRERIHILHCHLWTASFWGRLATWLRKVPLVVITEHNLDTWRNRARLMSDRFLARRTDCMIFVSAKVRTFYQNYLDLPKEKYRLIYNGVDITGLDGNRDGNETREKLGIPVKRRVIGVVGRLENRKGHRFFMDSVRSLAVRESRALGLIVGEGKARGDLESYRDALGLHDQIQFLGFCPDLGEALSVMDIFVMPSRMEGFPLAILEAMAAGKPVVATSVGGNDEAVQHGVTGLIVPYDDVQAMVQAILTLLQDDELRVKMGEAGQKRVREQFSLEAMVRDTQEVYFQGNQWAVRRGGDAA